MAEEARLESVYTSKAYPEFESRSLRQEGTTTTVAPSFSEDKKDTFLIDVIAPVDGENHKESVGLP